MKSIFRLFHMTVSCVKVHFRKAVLISAVQTTLISLYFQYDRNTLIKMNLFMRFMRWKRKLLRIAVFLKDYCNLNERSKHSY